MKRKLLAFLLTGGLALSTSTQSIAQNMKPIAFQEYDLANGLHVILYPEHSAPVIATRVFYHVGSKNEDPTRTGFAHFFEHLMFESTDHIKRGEYAKNVEMVGGNLNAATWSDKTVYMDNMPSNYLRQALWAEAERMHWLHVDSAGVETQRQVVKEERRNRYENQPYGTFFLNVMKAVMEGSKYEWTPIGSAQYIDQATIKEFQDFYHTYYVPNNAVLVVAGDLNVAEAKKAISDYFGSIPRGTEPIVRPTFNFQPQISEKMVEVKEKMTPLPGIVYAWRTVALGDKDSYALDLLSKVLTEGNSSRITNRLVDKDQLAVEVEAFNDPMEASGVFATLAIAKAGVDPMNVRAALDDEIAKVQTNGITDAEYEKVRNQIKKDLITEAANVEQIAMKLAESYGFFRDANRVNTELDRYLAVTKDDIKRVANTYLTKESRNILTYTTPTEGQQQ